MPARNPAPDFLLEYVRGWPPGRLADGHVGQPDVGQVAERDVEGPAEAHHSAERRCGKATPLDLAQRLGGDAGRQGHLDEAAAGSRGP